MLHRIHPKLISLSIEKRGTDILKPGRVELRSMNVCQLTSLTHKLSKYTRYINTTRDNFDLLASLLKSENTLLKNKYKSVIPLYATIVLKNINRYKFAFYLDKHNVPTTWNYFPLYYYNAYKKYKIVNNEETEKFWKKIISVPFKYPLDKREIEYISRIINNFKQ